MLALGVAVDIVESHTIGMLVDNEAGVLARVIGLFSGRGYNIDSLTVAEVDPETSQSRITIVTSGTPAVIEQIKAQLDRLVPVHKVSDLTVEGPHVERELALIKVAGRGEKRVESLRIADIFRGPRGRQHQRVLRLRDDRNFGKAQRLHQPDGAPGPGRCLAHRRGRHRARR